MIRNIVRIQNSKIALMKVALIAKERTLNHSFLMIDEEPYQNKVGMLSRLEKEDLEDSKIKYIFNKGKSDAHYWVRMVAERPFRESR